MVNLECPFCNQTIEIQPPGRLHVAFSSERPIVNSYYGNVIEMRVECPNCGQILKIYWFAPLEYFSRV